MKKELFYKFLIGVLLVIVFGQWIFIARITKPKPLPRKIPVAAKFKGKIAIVLDDWGYNLNNLPIVEGISYPLTASILPNLSYSKEISSQLHKRGFEIILHLPMEPHESINLEKNTISSNLSDESIRSIVSQDLANIVYAKGLSNHMGSAATEDIRVMEAVFRELKKRGFYFLDSFVTSRSICEGLTRKIGLGFAKRDVFLDNIEEQGYIKGQINKLKTLARMRGVAIGIGHDRKITLEVLKEVMPELAKEGYKFVFVSELVKK